MTKAILVNRIATRLNLNKSDALMAVQTILDSLIRVLQWMFAKQVRDNPVEPIDFFDFRREGNWRVVATWSAGERDGAAGRVTPVAARSCIFGNSTTDGGEWPKLWRVLSLRTSAELKKDPRD